MNRCEYVSQKQLVQVQKAVGNYEHFRELTEEYAELVERQTRQEQATGKTGKKAPRTDR